MSSVTNNSRHKRRIEASDSDGVDRISNLPESILSHILSLLPTDNAVATCLLSKRWKFLWRNIYNLSFTEDGDFDQHTTNEQNSLFAHFVNKVLLLLDQKCINKFVLKVKFFSDVHNVNNWIAAAVSRNAKVIKFWDYDYPYVRSVPFYMPSDLFTCKSLETLDLFGPINLNVPTVVSLPNLKTLSLQMVKYQSDESLPKLILGCSALENLYVTRYAYDNVVNLTISSPTLRNITLDFDTEGRFPEEFHYKLVINAPQLYYLKLTDDMLKDFSLENLFLLEKAEIFLYIDESLIQDDQYSKAIVKLLQGLYNVKNLSLDCDVPKALEYARFSASFPRLSQLTMGATCSTHSLLNFVEGSEKLEVLEVYKHDSCEHEQAKCWIKPEKVPNCLLMCLKTVSFMHIHGVEDDLKLIAYILKYAKVLRTMTITPFSLAKPELVQKVTEFFRGSEECEVRFLK